MQNKRLASLFAILIISLFLTNAACANKHKHYISINFGDVSVKRGEKFTARITFQSVSDKEMSGTASVSANGLEFISSSVSIGSGITSENSIVINGTKSLAGDVIQFECLYTYKVLNDYTGTPSISVDGSGISASCNVSHKDEQYFGSNQKTINILEDTHEHSFAEDESARVPATCGKDGSIILICSCGESKIKVLPKTSEHDYGDPEITLKPSCKSQGEQKRYCKVCKSEITEKIDKLAHDYSGETEEIITNCTENKKIRIYCVYDCGYYIIKETDPPGHNLKEQIFEPDCENPKRIVKTCSRCDYKESVTEGEALGHKWSSGALPENYNCNDGGIIINTCIVCPKTEEEQIAPKGHTPDAQFIIIKKPTCTESGYSGVFCIVCKAEIEKERKYFPEQGHQFTTWNPPENADCEKGYTESSKCDNCSELLSRTVPPGEHRYGGWYNVVMPLCNKEGSKTKICSVCGHEYTEKIPETNYHRYKEETQLIESTCTEKGYIIKTCRDCGFIIKNELALKEHDWLEPFDIVKRTCTDDGSYKNKCSQCGKIETFVEKASGHRLQHEKTIQERTCEQDGIYVRVCAVCNEEIRRTESASGHYYASWEIIKEPTCIEDGRKKAVCINCRIKTSEVIEKSEKYHKMSIMNEIQKANCGQERIYEWVCEICGFANRFTSSPVGEHRFGEWSASVQPTCIEEGEGKRVCEVCGQEETKKLKPAGHKFSRWKTEVKSTCVAEGLFKRNCENCDFFETKSIEINPDRHSFDEWTYTLEPLCEQEGEQTRICGLCAHTEKRIAKAKGHSFSRWKTHYAATCDQEGEAKRSCKVCGTEETKTIPISENRHKYNNWEESIPADCENTGIKLRQCESCGYEETGTIPALRHRFSNWKTQESAGCSKEGVSTRYCEKCGKIENKAIPISENRHIFNEWEETLPPGCGIDGSESRNCANCGYSETRSVKALSHRYGPWSKESYADCEQGGKQTRRCKNCGLEETRITEAKTHNFSKWENGKKNSCTQSGEKYRTCKRCGHVEHKSLSARGHKPGRFKTVKKAEAFTPGIQQRICKNCGQILEEREYKLSKEAMAVTFSPLGIPITELLPERTEQWYMIVPIEIEKPNEIKLPIVADNKRIIGEITVSVTNKDILTKVDYTEKDTEELNVLLHFYSSLDELTPKRIKYRYKGLDINNPTPLSKFAGKDVIIMYLRIEGVYDGRSASNAIFDIQDYEDEILKMYELLDRIV